MEQAGLFAPEPSYNALAAVKAALVKRTGLLGIGGAWGGRQLVYRHFIAGFGTDTQKSALMGKGVSVAISEPDVGAHPKLLTTRAVIDGDVVRISGQKAWVSNGPSADAILVFAITAEVAGRKRYGAFLVPRETPGLTLKEMPGFHALRPSCHCGLVLDGCEVSRAAQLGPEDVAYDRMAIGFRDVEDAVGTVALLGGFQYLLPRLGRAGHKGTDEALSLGAIVALIAVYEEAAKAVIASLDEGRLNHTSAALVGLRVLATHIIAEIHTHAARFGLADDAASATMLGDITAVQGIARGPRNARQSRLAAEFFAD